MASPPRNDAWKPYQDIRFVLVARPGRTLPPYRGIVLDQKLLDSRIHLLVHYWVDDGHPRPHARLDWIHRRGCSPVHVDPNQIGRSD